MGTSRGRAAQRNGGNEKSPSRHPATNRIRVLLADDHQGVRQAVARRLAKEPDLEIVGQAPDGPTAISLASQLRPDVVVMDVSMRGMHGIEATRQIRSQCPATRVIGFSVFAAPEHVAAMRKAGATDYLTKREAPGSLITAIRACVVHSSKHSARKSASARPSTSAGRA